MIVEQGDHELVEQLNNARYASLTSRAVTDAAHGIVDSLISFVEGGEEYRKSRTVQARREGAICSPQNNGRLGRRSAARVRG